jgi:D-glycero-D-manno-heptose 1,7-bisphosphate phosphatase
LPKTGVFLDRDDTIIRDMVYLSDPGKIEILPRVVDAIRALNEKNIPAIIVTNQSGIARGILDEEKLSEIHMHLLNMLAKQEARIDAIYYCPHHPEGNPGKYSRACSCRKPEPGLLLQAAEDFCLELRSCYMIGDKSIDVETIHRVGGKGILLSTTTDHDIQQRPDHIAHDLHEAVNWVLEDILR